MPPLQKRFHRKSCNLTDSGEHLVCKMERTKKMKKILSILMVLVLAFSLCACEELDSLRNIELPPLPDADASASPEISAEPEPEVTETPVETTAPEAEELNNRVIVSVINTVLHENDPQNGTELILTFAYESPLVYIEGRDAAAAAINDYLALLDETYYTGNDHGVGTAIGYNMFLELAQDNYSYVVSNGIEDISLEFSASRSANIARADAQVLSLVYNYYEFTGGVHGNYYDRAYVFDTETGAELSLDALTSDFDALTAFLVQYMVETAESDSYYSERIDPNTVPAEQYSAAFGQLIREGSWYFGAEGLVIFSDTYELGPYAAGIVEFTVPYEQLEGKIDEKWLPEQRNGEGEFGIDLLSDIPDGSLEIIDRVTADDTGAEFCLSVEGTAYDVKLSRVDYTDTFFETAQLWYCSYMSDCAIQVLATLPEGMPDLMLSYNTADGQAHTLLVSESGEDGSLILVDGLIEAVG